MDALLFPPRCVVCDEILAPEEIKKGIHPACENKLYPVTGAVCMHCGRPLGHIKSPKRSLPSTKKESIENNLPDHLKIESVREYCEECHRKGYVKHSNIIQGNALYLYKGAVKNSMYRLKYANKREYAEYFAEKAVQNYGGRIKNQQLEAIISVPMYEKKQKKRGYNQAETFAAALSLRIGIPVDEKYVKRIKDTTPQKELTGKERKNNLENAFQIQKNIVKYNKVLIVDDIYTTGCTAEAVAKELKKNGTSEVYLLTICIGE